jgi:hypothetical protein
VFTAASFVIAPNWQQPRCLSIPWTNYIRFTREYHSAIKSNKLLKHATPNGSRKHCAKFKEALHKKQKWQFIWNSRIGKSTQSGKLRALFVWGGGWGGDWLKNVMRDLSGLIVMFFTLRGYRGIHTGQNARECTLNIMHCVPSVRLGVQSTAALQK